MGSRTGIRRVVEGRQALSELDWIFALHRDIWRVARAKSSSGLVSARLKR